MRTHLTTAIAYVNAEPHVGFAFELVLADALARYRAKKEEVRFQTGTDENSLKNVRAAVLAGLETRTFVDRNAEVFRTLVERLGLRVDRFIRTTEPAHRAAVEKLWRAAAADLYRSRYHGLYCVGCEAFVGERDLDDGRCPEHQSRPEVVEEENFFFRLSRYAGPIREAIRSGRLAIRPEAVKREVLAQLEDLGDLSVSRPAERAGGWGIRVPGSPDDVVYVWFDALANYLSGCGYAGDPALFERWWIDARRVHVVGTGIVRFHAIIWPALLLSAGLPLPDEIVVHGYLTRNQRKIAKSLGNTIDPLALVDRYGTEAVRYLLLRVRTLDGGDVSPERFDATYGAELVDGLGNLVARTRRLVELAGIGGEVRGIDPEYGDDPARLAGRVDASVERLALDEALGEIWRFVDRTNAYLQVNEPWQLLKQGGLQPRVVRVLGTAEAALSAISAALEPFLPRTAEAIRTRAPGPLFPRLAPGDAGP